MRRVGLGGSSPPARSERGWFSVGSLGQVGSSVAGFFFLFSPWLLQCCGTCMGHERRNWRHAVMVCSQSPLGAALAPRSSVGAISFAVFLTGPTPPPGKATQRQLDQRHPGGGTGDSLRPLSSPNPSAVCLSTLILSQSVTARGTAGNGDSPQAIRSKTRSAIPRDVFGAAVGVGGRRF